MGVLDGAFTQWADDTSADEADAKSGKSSTRREFEAALRDQLGEVGSAGALFGIPGAQDLSDSQKKAAARLRSRSTYVQSLDDVKGVGDFASYATRGAINLAPTIAEMLVGGGIGGAIGKAAAGVTDSMTAAEKAAVIARASKTGTMIGAVAPTEPTSVGQVADAEREQSGSADPVSSVALGTAANALNLVGGAGKIATTGLRKSALDSVLARAGVGAVTTGAEQAGISAAQQGLSEAGRASVDPEFDMLGADSQKRVTEAAIAGGTLGGLIGGVHGAANKKAAAPAPVREPDAGTAGEAADILALPKPEAREPGAIRVYDSGDATSAPAIDAEFFTGATPETLRPTNGPDSIKRAIRGSGKNFAVVAKLADDVSSALTKQDVPAATEAILNAEAHVASKKGAPSDSLAQVQSSLAAARDIVNQFSKQMEELAPGRIAEQANAHQSKPSTPSYDPLTEIPDLEPKPVKPPKLETVRSTLAPGSDRRSMDLVPRLHAAMASGDPTAMGKILSDYAEKLENSKNDPNIKPKTIDTRTRVLDAANKLVEDHTAKLKQYNADTEAYNTLLDEATRPADAAPVAQLPDVNALAQQGLARAKPGTDTTTPRDTSGAAEQARVQNDQAQNARGTPDSGNQNQARADLLQEAFASGERNVRGVFQQLLKASYPHDKTAWALTADEVRSIIKHVQNRRNLDLKAGVTEKLTDAINNEALEPLPPPETQDTTLGVKEKAPKPEKPAEPEKPAKQDVKPTEPVQGEMFRERDMRPVGRTREKRFEREREQRAAVTGERQPEPTPAPRSNADQGELFQKNGKPTVAARGESRASRDFQVEQARNAAGKAAKAVMSQLDKHVADNPDTPSGEVIRVAKLVQERKFAEAGRQLGAMQERALAKRRTPDIKPEEAQARGNFQKLMADYENDVAGSIPDKVIGHIEKGEYDKANALVTKERARIEKIIEKAGTTPEAAKPQGPKKEPSGGPLETGRALEETLAARKPSKEERAAAAARAREADPEGTARRMDARRGASDDAASDYAGTYPRASVEKAIMDRLERGDMDGPEAKAALRDIASNDPDKIAAVEDSVFAGKKKPDQGRFQRASDFRRESTDYSNTAPARVEEVKRDVDEITKDWKNAPQIEVFDARHPENTDQQRFIRTAFSHELDLMGGEVSGFFDPESGKVMIPVQGAVSRALVRATVFHESLAHYGLREAFGERLDNLMNELYEKNAELRAEADAYMKKWGLTDTREGIEEAVAERFEKNPDMKQGLFSRIKGALEAFARRMGWRTADFSADEVASILRKAREAVVDRNPPPRGGRDTSLPTRSRVTEDGRAFYKRTAEDQLRDTLGKAGTLPHVAEVAITSRTLGRKMLQGMMFGRDLVDFVRDKLPTYGEYHTLMQEKQQVINDYTRDIDQLMVETSRLPAADQRGLSEFMMQATMSDKWGYQPKWLTEATPDGRSTKPKMVATDPVQRQKWAALTDDQRRLADEYFRIGFKSREDTRNAVRAEIDNDANTSAAGARNTTERREIERQRVRAAKLFDNKVPVRNGPYVPLSRFGDYIAVGKSKAYKAQEAIENPTAADREKLEDMRSDPSHYFVSMHDSMGKADARRLELQEKGFESYAAPREQFYQTANEAPWFSMLKLKQMVQDQLGQTDQFNKSTTHHINMLLRDLYYSSLAEDSARKHDLKRDSVAGVEPDQILRGIAQKGRADARFIGSLLKNGQIQRSLQKMREESKIEDGKRTDRALAFNEVLQRHAQSMEYDPTPYQDKAMAVSSFWYLMTSPRYYIQNSLQTAMVTAPVLSAQHGFTKAWGHILGAYKAFAPVLKDSASMRDFAAGKFNIDELKGLSKDEADFLKDQRRTGLVDIGLNYDQGYWEGGNNMVSKKLTQWTHNLRTWSQQVEVLNRVSAGLSAYRLGREKGMSHADASSYASGIIAQTHGDYSRSNAPRYFNMLPKVVTQFRKYQLIQLSLLARQAYNSFDGKLSSEDRYVARKTLGYVLGQTALVTGAFGVPAVQAISGILSAMFGPDDEPADGEKWLRDAIGNNDVANLILKGAPAAAGVDLSSSLGMGTALSVLPYGNFDPTSRQGLNDIAVQAMGPAFGVAQHLADGLGLIHLGAYQKGIETMMPAGFRNIMKAYREGTEGVTNRQGDALMKPDEIGFMNTVLTSLGFTPTDVQDQRRVQAITREYENYFKDRTSQIRYAFTQAAKDNDIEAMSVQRDAWQKLQESKKRVGFKPTPISNLLSAPREQTKREKLAKGGVAARTNNQKFVEESLAE